VPSQMNFSKLLIFCLSLLVFTVGLTYQEITGFESRFFLFAQEMSRHGVTWFPTVYHEPYPDYPATGTFLIYLCAKLFGALNKFTAVLPSAIASALTVVATFCIGKTQSVRWGWFAVLFLFLTNAFVVQARTISPDAFIACITAWSFYIALTRKPLIYGFGLFFLGFAFRGPIGLVVPVGVVCMMNIVNKDYYRFFIIAFGSLFLLCGCLSILFGLAYLSGGESFVHSVWHLQVTGRLQNASLPLYFYFKESFGAYALTFPLGICVLLAGSIATIFDDKQKKFLLSLVVWAAVIVIGLSIPAGKKIRYILAMAPALALLSAYLFATVPTTRRGQLLKKLTYYVCVFMPGLFFLVGTIIRYKTNIVSLHHTLFGPILFLFLLQMISLIFASLHQKKDLLIVALAALAFVVSDRTH
jgi:4-amino-4-deoxy-L-arabinose transferase-like glycosyltransferase